MLHNDTFSAADGTLLTAHTPESGGSYGLNPLGTGAIRIDAGRAHADGPAFAYSSVSATDYEIEAVIRCLSADGQYAGILGRMSTTTADWYSLLLQFGGGITLFGATNLGTHAMTFTPGSEYRVKLSLRGTLIRAFLDRCEILRTTDATHGSGRIGCCFGGATSVSTGMHLDSLSASAGFATSQYLFVGDSLTSGQGVITLSHAEKYPTLVMSALNNGADWANRAVSGSTLAAMIDAMDEIDVCRRPNAARDVVVIWGGINDLAIGGASVDDVIHRLTTLGDGRQALGFRTTVLTLIAADESHPNIPAGYNARRTAVNAWLRENWQDHFDALADVAADSRLSDPQDEAYFQTDGVHLSAGGAAVVAGIVTAALETLDEASVRIRRPTTGDVLLVGQPAIIEWRTTGDISDVWIELSTNGGVSFDVTLAHGLADTGSLNWTPSLAHLTPAARLRILVNGSEAMAESALFPIATTSTAADGVTAEELEAALASLREHGDAQWGRNPILPVIARVNSDPVARTTLQAYQRGRTIHRLIVVDATGMNVSLAGKSLQFCLETLTGAIIARHGISQHFGRRLPGRGSDRAAGVACPGRTVSLCAPRSRRWRPRLGPWRLRRRTHSRPGLTSPPACLERAAGGSGSV